MTTQLTKPQFVKVKDLENARSGYNVYVKVVSVEKSQTQSNFPIVRAVLADQTGAANAFFKGDNAALIEQGKVIAIRNGTINLVKSKISLEVDIFGRITSETVEIKQVNTTNNISDKQVERKPRRQPRERRQDGRPRREGEERRPRRQGAFDRRPRRQDEQRRPRREGEERRPRRQGDFDRRPRRQDEQRRPRREGEERRNQPRDEQRGDRRPPIKFTKISAIEPGDEGLNFFGKVISFEQIGKKARVVLGDETAIVRAFLFADEQVKVGESIVLFGAEARVVKEHIEIQVPREGKVDKARRKVEDVNQNVDISAKEWVEAA